MWWGRRDGEGGAVAIVSVLFIAFVIGAFLALSANLGWMMETRTELQRASDSAALAAAGSLNGVAAGLGAARGMADVYSSAHTVTREAVQIDADSDVVFGRWHRAVESCVFSAGRCGPGFEVSPNPVADAFAVTAVQLTNGRDRVGTHNTPLPTLFGGAFLADRQNEIDSRAVAVGPGALSGCSLPFLLPTCMLLQPSGPPCNTPITLYYGSDTADGVGLVNLFGGSSAPNPANVPDMIRRSCLKPVWTGDYPFGNGNDMNQQIIDALLGTDGSGVCHFNASLMFPVAELGCPNPRFSGAGTLLRFVSATVLQVTDNQGLPYDATSCGSGSSSSAAGGNGKSGGNGGGGGRGGGGGGGSRGGGPKRSITLRIDCDASGGFSLPQAARVLRLVQ